MEQRNEKLFIQQLDQFIVQHIGDAHFSIEDICQELGLSRSQLFRLLKEHTALSPSRYIRQHRLQKAKELLESTDLKIAEITYRIGLDSPQTFTKFFSEDFGMSPSEYRKRSTKETETNYQANAGQALAMEDFLEPSTALSSSERSTKYVWLYRGIAVVLALVILGGGYWWSASHLVKEEDLSIVILPFDHSKTDTTLLAESAFDQVYGSLIQNENLRVISRNSSMLVANSAKTIPQIAQELKVNYVLTGRIKQLGKEVSISVEFIKAAEDQVLWNHTFQGKAPNANIFLRKVAQEVNVALNQKLTNNSPQKIERVIAENFEAYQEYLQGKHLMQRRTKETLEASIVRFDKAIALEPNFADAFANKASAYFILGSLQDMNLKEYLKLSEQNALTAIRLDPQNPLAYATLANGYRQLNKWEQAITTYQIALQYSPNDAQINYWYSLALRSLGYLEEAIRYSTKAVSVDPLQPTVVVGHIGNLSYAHRFEAAQELFQNYELTLRDFYTYYFVKGFFYINQGDFVSAIKAFRRCDSLNPEHPGHHYQLYCQAKLGNRKATEDFIKTVPSIPENSVTLSVLYAGLGDKDNCIRYLNWGADNGFVHEYLKISSIYSFLHGDPRFEAILSKLGLNKPISALDPL